jgi:hypothetical protein
MCTLSLTDNNKHVLKYSDFAGATRYYKTDRSLRPVACNGRLFA